MPLFRGCHIVFALQGEALPANGRCFGSGLATMCTSSTLFIATKI